MIKGFLTYLIINIIPENKREYSKLLRVFKTYVKHRYEIYEGSDFFESCKIVKKEGGWTIEKNGQTIHELNSKNLFVLKVVYNEIGMNLNR